MTSATSMGRNPAKKHIIFDRDGTLIDLLRDEETGSIYTAFHPSHLRVLPGVIEGLQKLQQAGFSFSIATNQPGVAKGHFSLNAVTQTHQELTKLFVAQGIPFEAIEACLHHPESFPQGDLSLQTSCDCRKPQPGMLLKLMSQLQLDASQTWMVGDAASDVEAGQAAGIRTAYVRPNMRCESCPRLQGISADISGSFLDICRQLAAQK